MAIHSLPHARGGVSTSSLRSTARAPSSPRPWGCFQLTCPHLFLTLVFPTPVGVFLIYPQFDDDAPGLPHARGGVSLLIVCWPCVAGSSPRPWGCFLRWQSVRRMLIVFPTPVGVFLAFGSISGIGICLPHARGGVSKDDVRKNFPVVSSPRPWGCFRHARVCLRKDRVFPTPVGVFPHYLGRHAFNGSLPHARGGVSTKVVASSTCPLSSPRPWGCFHV